MSWNFKPSFGRQKDVPAYQPPAQLGDECQHDFTNWTDPVSITTKQVVGLTMFGGEVTDVDKWQQDRRCLKCNLAQKRLT